MEITISIKVDGQEVVNQKIEKSEKKSEKTYSQYARVFDDGCTGWTRDAEYNLLFLRQQQTYANDLLKARGHVFLNEVYELLGIPKSKEGQIVGWVYEENNPIGDNHIDFGIYDCSTVAQRNFINGFERSVLLDFNVDGCILDRID